MKTFCILFSIICLMGWFYMVMIEPHKPRIKFIPNVNLKTEVTLYWIDKNKKEHSKILFSF